jgi:hypothetical protein
MLLIPGKCLAILRAVWNFHYVRFFEKPQHRGAETRFQIQAKRQAIGEAKGDNKIAAIVDDVGNNGEGSA